MTRKIPLSKIIETSFDQHSRLTENLLNGNNFQSRDYKPAYYWEKYGYQAAVFHKEVVVGNLEYISEDFEKLKEFVVDMIKSYEDDSE